MYRPYNFIAILGVLVASFPSCCLFAQATSTSPQTDSKLNTPTLIERYTPFAEFPEEYVAVGLTDALYRFCPNQTLEHAINTYWKAVRAASDWKFYRQRVETLNSLNLQSDPVASLYLKQTEAKAGMAHLKMRRLAIELNVIINDCGFKSEKLPYCNEMPHFGIYQTNIDSLARVRAISSEMRLVSRRIELGYEQIKAAASALASAIYLLEAQTELKSSGSATVTDLINAFEQEESARSVFWESVLSYNQDILRYVLWTQMGRPYNPKELASILILNPRAGTPLVTSENRNPKSVLEQRPETYKTPINVPAPPSNNTTTPPNTVPQTTIPANSAPITPSAVPSTVPTTPNPTTPLPADLSPVPSTVPADDIDPLPTAPSNMEPSTPLIKNEQKETVYQVAFTPSEELSKPNWFDVVMYKPAGTQAITLKGYLRYFRPSVYQLATNEYWRTAAQCQKLAAVNVALRRANEVQQKVFARLSQQGNQTQSTLFLLSMNLWKQSLNVQSFKTQKSILGAQFYMNQLLEQNGISNRLLFWPITPFHADSYEVANNVSRLDQDSIVKPLSASIIQEFNLMNQTKASLELTSVQVDRDTSSENANYKTIVAELQTEFYFVEALLNQTVEYNFSIGNYVERWIYARNTTLNLDAFCQCLVTKME